MRSTYWRPYNIAPLLRGPGGRWRVKRPFVDGYEAAGGRRLQGGMPKALEPLG